MNFGMVLPTCLYSAERQATVERSYASLVRTAIPARFTPVPLFVVAAGRHTFDVAMKQLAGTLEMGLLPNILLQPDEVRGPDSAVAWITDKIFAETHTSHLIELADDMVYHPTWFLELTALVERHPDARAWSVYRSAHTRHHRTLLRGAAEDHMVTSLAGNGTCWTREEWAAWGVKWEYGSYPNPDSGNTLDLHHAYFRPGERWATDKSFMQHIGTTNGAHVISGVPEFALNFAGEE